MAWSRDPGCSGLFQPQPPREGDFATEAQFNDAFSTYVEDWFDWWGGCTNDLPEEPPEPPIGPPLPPQPPPCVPGRWIQDGQCWERICTHDGPVIQPCFGGRAPFGDIFPRIESIGLGINGFVVVVMPAPGKERSVQQVNPRKLRLLPLVRAMLHGSRLPSSDVSEVSKSFWAQQEKIGRLTEFSTLESRVARVKLLGKRSASARRSKK
jgi:hypothetical protein